MGIAYQVKDDLEDRHQSEARVRDVSLLAVIEAFGGDASSRAEQLFEHYRNEAVRVLSALSSAGLAWLLRRLTVRILKRQANA